MDTKFDFQQVGKRMPYFAPDGFLKDMETHVLEAVKNDRHESLFLQQQKKRSAFKVIWTAALAVAASVAVLFVLHIDFSGPKSPQVDNSIKAVDQAFAHLSSADQAFLLDVYQDDVFLNN